MADLELDFGFAAGTLTGNRLHGSETLATSPNTLSSPRTSQRARRDGGGVLKHVTEEGHFPTREEDYGSVVHVTVESGSGESDPGPVVGSWLKDDKAYRPPYYYHERKVY